jgi:sugar lactone lactonase YvrE
MAFDQRPGAGALYRLDLDGTITTVLDGLTISNGLAWSPDDRTVYLADSGPGLLYAFDYDLGSGAFSHQRVLVDFTDQAGVADGLTVDDDGCIWTALWGGGQVRRWSPEGELLAIVELPVPQVSSCAFAGAAGDLLVISTSAQGLDEEARRAQPDAGKLFTARPGATGAAAFPYRGRLSGLRQLL